MTAPAIHMRKYVVRIFVGIHPLRAAFDDSTATYITTMTIPPIWLLQANYSSTILGIQYNDSAVIIHAIPPTPLTILTALIPLNKSAYTFPFDNSADTLWRFHRNPLMTLRKSFGDSAEILWWFRRWSADYSYGESADIVKFCCDMYHMVYDNTSIEARLWRASLLRRASNGAWVPALRRWWFGLTVLPQMHYLWIYLLQWLTL